MEKTYQYDNQLIKGLERYYPDVVTRLNYPGSLENIRKIEEEIGEDLPESFKKLYQQFDGENKQLYVGLILGFTLLDAESVLREIRFFKEHNGDMTMDSMHGEAISEEEMEKRILVPFAFDDSSCFIALDLTPGKKGKKGQVITLDFDYRNSFLLADSLDEFYNFILKMMDEKKCQIAIGDEDEEYFEFESGHFFNNLEELLANLNEKDMGEKAEEIILPKEFWQNLFERECISTAELEKEKILTIHYDGKNISLMPLRHMKNLKELRIYIEGAKVEDWEAITVLSSLKELQICYDGENISLTPLRYMKNLKELRICSKGAKVEDWEAIAILSSLKDISLSCKIENRELELLCGLPKLRKVCFDNMDLENLCIRCFASSKTIKSLYLSRITNLNLDDLATLGKLQELWMDDMKIPNLEFMKKLKNLKKIEFKDVDVDNLDFLEYTKKLTEFKMEYIAKDESGLKFLPELKKLKAFKYPVADLSLYEGMENLTDIGIDIKKMNNLEYLKNTHVSSATLFGAESEDEAENAVAEIEKYITLYSYRYNCSWMDE